MMSTTTAQSNERASGGSGVLTNIATSANQPDVQTLNFHQSTQQHCQFAIPLPKRWNRGTITARFRWSHAATTTNFGVVWGIQAVAVGDDEAINQSIRYINLADDTLAGDLDEVLRRIVSEVEAHSPSLVFVDSFRSVVMASQTQHNPNNNLPQFVQQLGMLMTTWQASLAVASV